MREVEVLEALLRCPAVAIRRVDAVWLFGSRARGDFTAASDIDLAVLCEPALGLDRTKVMDQLARAVGVETDVIDLATAHPALTWEILTTGRPLFERDEELVENFVRRARFAAEDAEQRDRMVLLAQAGHVGRALR
jgi:predicted nucleotidyltransferase